MSMLRRERLHPRQKGIACREKGVEIFSLYAFDDLIDAGFHRRSLAQAGAPVTRTAALVGDGDDENDLTTNHVYDVVAKADYLPDAGAEEMWTSRIRKLKQKITARSKSSDESIAISSPFPVVIEHRIV